MLVQVPRLPRPTLFPYTTLFRSKSTQVSTADDACTSIWYIQRESTTARWRMASLKKLRSEEHTSELQSRGHLVCRLLLEKKTVQSPSTRSAGSAMHCSPRQAGQA